MIASLFAGRKSLVVVTASLTALFAFACGSDTGSQPTATPFPVTQTPTSAPATETPAPPTATPAPATPTPSVDIHPMLGEPFDLLLGGSVFLDANGYRITFVRIVSDNRCPLNVTCITGGAVVVELLVRQSVRGPDVPYLWSVGADRPEPSIRTIDAFEIELLDVEPVPGGAAGPTQAVMVVDNAGARTLSLDAQEEPVSVKTGETFVVTPEALASRNTHFRWTTPPCRLSTTRAQRCEAQTRISFKRDSITEIVEFWTVSPQDVAYVDDVPQDVVEAKSAGEKALAAVWAPTVDHAAIELVRLDAKLASPADLMEWLLARG